MFTPEDAYKLRELVRGQLEHGKSKLGAVAAGRIVGIIHAGADTPFVEKSLLTRITACLKARNERPDDLLAGWEEWDMFVRVLDRNTVGVTQ